MSSRKMSSRNMPQDPYANGNANMGLTERTALISARLKTMYKKSILPVEKRFRYDYFYESPLLSDIEFDCKCFNVTQTIKI